MRKRTSLKIAFLFVLIWFLAASILLDWWPLIRPSNEWETITNLEYGFSVEYPTKWKAATYGEHGFKGGDDIKLRIYRSAFGAFVISVRYRAANNPSLEDVVTWGDRRIAEINGNYLQRGQTGCEILDEWSDVIREQEVIRRRYDCGDTSKEDVYIARTNDLIIIILQTDKGELDSYIEDFEAIVASFRPID